MKKVILTETQIKQVVREMISRDNGLINEISAKDAFTKFYSRKIPEDIYTELMAGAPVMTPLHKLALDKIAQWYKFQDGEYNELESDRRIALEMAETVKKFWETASPEAKQYVMDLLPTTPQEKDDMSVWYLKNILTNAMRMKHHTEAQFADNGYVIIKDTPRYLITCTTSYTASKKYYGDSHWCTASDVAGRFNGFEMFGDYTGMKDDAMDDPAILIQIVDKENRENTIQAQIFDDGELGDICGFNGKSNRQGFEDIMKSLGYESAVGMIGGEEMLQKLLDETQENYNNEYDYWTRRGEIALRKKKEDFMTKESLYESPILKVIDENIKANKDSIYYMAPHYGPICFSIEEITDENYNLRNGVRLFNITLKGTTKEEISWMIDSYNADEWRVLTGFNCQGWLIDTKGGTLKIIKKFPGYFDDLRQNTATINPGDSNTDSDHGPGNLINIQNGMVLVKEYKEMRNLHSYKQFTSEKDGHLILFYMETVKGSDKWYPAMIDALTCKYLGHADEKIIGDSEFYGNAKMIFDK